MEVENRTKIKEVKVLHPEFVASNFSQLVKKEYEDIQSLKTTLANLRMKANELEEEIKIKENTFRDLSKLFTLEFETEDIKYSTNECSLAIINQEDARNI